MIQTLIDQVQHYIDNHSETYNILCHKACIIPDNTWRQYHATCNVFRKTHDKEDVKTLGEIENISIFITAMAAKIDISLDDLQIDFYKRKSDWKAGANLRYELKTLFLICFRIKELRTEKVEVIIEGRGRNDN